jgi:hypothetical protein
MASVLQAPEDTWSFQPLEGAHFQRSFQRIESMPPAVTVTTGVSTSTEEPVRPRDEGCGISLDAMVPNATGVNLTDQWKAQQKDHPEVCIPTNPGTLLHPGSCTPCAFVFRVAEGQVRNRCTNGDECGWCHHPSHPRTRGRRQKNGASARQKEAEQQQDAWTDKNGGNGSETSTRDTGSDRDNKNDKNDSWTEGEDHPKINRSTKDDRGNSKSSRSTRDDRAKTNRQQRNGRDDRSKNFRMPDYYAPEKVERCNTPEFDEQYACYPRPQQPQGLTGVMQQDNCYGQPTQILYSCVPVNVAVPAPAAEGMPEWTGYSPTATYMHDWNASYQPEVRPYAPQQYMMLPMHQPQPQWPHGGSMPMANDGAQRSQGNSFERA